MVLLVPPPDHGLRNLCIGGQGQEHSLEGISRCFHIGKGHGSEERKPLLLIWLDEQRLNKFRWLLNCLAWWGLRQFPALLEKVPTSWQIPLEIAKSVRMHLSRVVFLLH